MPSSHSQFLGFFAAFFLAHFYLNRPPSLRPRTLINSMRRFEHHLAMLLIAAISILTCYSRHHLHYHTPLQIIVGLSIGLAFGATYYYFTEHLPRKPLRLPAPLAVSESSSPLAIRANRLLQPISTSRANATTNTTARNRKPRRRSSTLSDILLPELHPSPPFARSCSTTPLPSLSASGTAGPCGPTAASRENTARGDASGKREERPSLPPPPPLQPPIATEPTSADCSDITSS